jgi:uncharacterized membrane protein YgdD (TMEM256/DUF423 family)
MTDNTMSAPGQLPQAGWYQDPNGSTRWWDGQQWTDQVQSVPAPAPVPSDPGSAFFVPSAVTPAPSPATQAYGTAGVSAPSDAQLRAARNKANGLMAGGIAAFLVGLFSLLNAESHGGLIWIGGFLFGGSLFLRGLKLNSAVNRHRR